MKTSLLRFILSLSAAVLLTQCVVPEDPYYSGGFQSSSPAYYTRPSTGFFGSPGYFGDPGYFGGTGFGFNHRLCSVCRRNPCCCRSNGGHNHPTRPAFRADDHRDHDHDRSRGVVASMNGRSSSSRSSSSSSSSQRRDSDGDKLYRYSSRDRDMPQGNHTREWYKDRGYDMGKLRPSR
jgi:hypothetical protein